MTYKNPKEKEMDMIENILDNFDFYKCWNVMTMLQWGWGFNSEVPTIEILRNAAIDRLKNAMSLAKAGNSHMSSYWVSSGGLKATAWKNKYNHIEGIRLEFVLTDWDADGDY